MTPEALGAALKDLAEHGWVLLFRREDADAVAEAAPVPTRVVDISSIATHRYIVEEVKA